MKNMLRKVMSALLVMAMLVGVLAVPTQKAEAKVTKNDFDMKAALAEMEGKPTKKQWKEARKAVNREYKRFMKKKPFDFNKFSNNLDCDDKASRLFDKKVAKKFKISPEYSFRWGILGRYADIESKKEVKQMHKELRYLSKLCSAIKKEYKQQVNRHGDYYRLMKYSPSEIKAEVLSDSLRKRISYEKYEKLSAARNKELDKKGDFQLIYEKKMNYDVKAIVHSFPPGMDWVLAEVDIIKALGYKAEALNRSGHINAYSVMLVKDGSNHNKKYWKPVRTYNGGQSCQYEKGGYVGKKRYKRAGVTSKEYWGTMLGECYPGQFSVGTNSENQAVMTVKSGTVIEIPQSYYVPKEDNDHIFTSGESVICSGSSNKISLQFSLDNPSDNSAEAKIDLMDKALHVTVIP